MKKFEVSVFEKNEGYLVTIEKPYFCGCTADYGATVEEAFMKTFKMFVREFPDEHMPWNKVFRWLDNYLLDDGYEYERGCSITTAQWLVFNGKDELLFSSSDKEAVDEYWEKNYVPHTGMYIRNPNNFVAVETDDLPF